jgi:hypothetical protein
VEAEPKLDNRNMIMVLAPDKRARQAAQSRASNQQRAEKGTDDAKGAPQAAVEANGSAVAADSTAADGAGAGSDSDVAASTEEG